MNGLSVKNVCFQYKGQNLIFEDLSFEIKPGSFAALAANNGSGKTTLIKILSGLLPIKSGAVFIGNDNISGKKVKNLYSKIGITFQNPDDQLFCLTVKEDVAFGPRNQGLSEEKIQQRVDDALSSVNALHLKEKPIHHLSFGEKKRVALACVLSMNPDILLLDEPTSGLDPRGEEEMMELLYSLNKKNKKTVFMATHNMDILPRHCNEIFILSEGKLKGGSTRSVFQNFKALKDAGLRLPYITQAFYELKKKGTIDSEKLPLTVNDAGKFLTSLIKKLKGGKRG